MTARQIVGKIKKGEKVYIEESKKDIFLEEILKHNLLDMNKNAKQHLCLKQCLRVYLIQNK